MMVMYRSLGRDVWADELGSGPMKVVCEAVGPEEARTIADALNAQTRTKSAYARYHVSPEIVMLPAYAHLINPHLVDTLGKVVGESGAVTFTEIDDPQKLGWRIRTATLQVVLPEGVTLEEGA